MRGVIKRLLLNERERGGGGRGEERTFVDHFPLEYGTGVGRLFVVMGNDWSDL